MRSQRQRLFLVLGLFALMALGFYLLTTVLRANLDGYRTPTELMDRSLDLGQSVSVGGMVVVGSLKPISEPVGSRFSITDCEVRIEVIREGTLPSLFAEGELTEVQGTITALSPLTLRATKVLAKHDQYYVPVNAQETLEKIRKEAC